MSKNRYKFTASSTELDIKEEDQDRILINYFDIEEIKASKDPLKNFMKQARAQKKEGGIIESIGKKAELARQFLNGFDGISISKNRRWSNEDIGKVKSLRTRGGNLAKLALTLARTPEAVYSLVKRLKKKGDIQ